MPHLMCLSTPQCSLLGFDIYLLTTPTTWAMSYFVHTITYIKLSPVETYGTLVIYFLSLSMFGDCFLERWKWLPIGVNLFLASWILNLLNNFSMYFFLDSLKGPFDLSLSILIPSICLAGLKSFISNFSANYCFNLLISFILDLATSILLTYNNNMI